jgi:hypothetical protein
MNETGRPPERPATTHDHLPKTIAAAGDGERAIVDLRCWLKGETKEDVYRLMLQLLASAQAAAPPGVSVRYYQMRNYAGGEFRPTMQRRRRRDA